MNQKQIEKQFNEMFKGATEFNYWRKGYNDCKQGKRPMMSDTEYLNGYAKSYEEMEKQSVRNN